MVMESFAYSPAELTVPVGATVTWTNRHAARHDKEAMLMRLGVILHRPLGAFGQLARDRLLHRIVQISPVLLRLAGLGQTRRRRLQPREGEVAVLAPQQRPRQIKARPVA